MAGRQDSIHIHHRLRLRPALLLVLALLAHMALSAPAWADDEAEFRAKPNAALAEKIARAALARDQVGKAMNWGERVAQTPGATLAQLNWLGKLRTDLRWRLNDAGLAAVQIRVTPPSADLLIDGVHVPFHTAMHTLWLPEGVHELEAIAVDHLTTTQSIGARRGEREIYVVELAPSKAPELIVHMVPEGDVIVDGALLGPSTKGRFATSAGRHLVELRAANHTGWVQEMTLKLGEVKRLDVRLQPTPAAMDPAVSHRAHQIDRPLLPSELAQGREKPMDRPDVAGSSLDTGIGARANADAATPETQRKARQATEAKANGAPPKPDEVNETPREGREPVREARAAPSDGGSRALERDGGAHTMERPDDGVSDRPSQSSGLSRTTKGWIYGGAGLAALGAGVAIAYLGAADAETANQLPRGSKTYADDYAAAANKTYIGYGAAGLGAVGVGVGAYYLFGQGGLNRKGKGWVVTSLGVLTAAAGSWLMLDASTLASDTDTKLSPSNPEYTRRFDLAERNRWIGVGVVGAGAAIIGTGIALIATAPSGSSAMATPPVGHERPALAWQIQPWMAGNASGATLHVGW
jgi:hypothetical protein